MENNNKKISGVFFNKKTFEDKFQEWYFHVHCKYCGADVLYTYMHMRKFFDDYSNSLVDICDMCWTLEKRKNGKSSK